MEEMQPMSKDASFLIAERAIDVTFDNIPDDVINTAKRSIPDTLGVIIGASGITPGKRTCDADQRFRGKAREQHPRIWRSCARLDGGFCQWRDGPLYGLR